MFAFSFCQKNTNYYQIHNYSWTCLQLVFHVIVLREKRWYKRRNSGTIKQKWNTKPSKKIFTFLPFPSAFSSSKQKLKHKLNINSKKKKIQRIHTKHCICKRRERTLRMWIALSRSSWLEWLVVKKISLCSVWEVKNRETIIEEKNY